MCKITPVFNPKLMQTCSFLKLMRTPEPNPPGSPLMKETASNTFVCELTTYRRNVKERLEV